MTELRILKKGSCPSLSGKSNLTYAIGIDDQDAVYLSLRSNTGGGYFSNEWVSLAAIQKTLAESPDHITATLLASLNRSKGIKGVNLMGFQLAALKHEGLVKAAKGKSRIHELADDYEERMAQLTSAQPKTKPSRRKASVKKKRAPARAKAR